MASQDITDVTLDELREWVDAQVDRRLQERLKPTDKRSVQEFNESIRRNRWTPPEGAPSNLELIRQDREQWNSITRCR